MKEESRLILALDETRKGKALEVAEEVSDLVAAIKINWPLVLSTSPEIIDELSRISDVICDFKVADIPNTNRLIVEQTVARGAKGIIVHGFTGSDSVRAAVEAAGDVEVFVVVEMSHPGGKEFTQSASERIARIAKESGAAGVIAPATRPERIREIRSMIGDLKILSPGVGAQGGSAADAISMGADFVIVGRVIYQADSPRSAAERMYEEARRAWANRPE
ncbi:MAG: orotidine-5'-phosphate decarboxylase [Methanomassiliicoccales archaeon]|nr:orotidine-5'-phosphate decarboxylase [Methanomassiliicoccales archaeon]NYT15076.1 orotidine-5'-phosphate decarboxylase [Methanomassiliicoccales archaeon]